MHTSVSDAGKRPFAAKSTNAAKSMSTQTCGILQPSLKMSCGAAFYGGTTHTVTVPLKVFNQPVVMAVCWSCYRNAGRCCEGKCLCNESR